jgi:beta-lactamase class A
VRLLGKVLSDSSRKLLLDWMIGSEITADLLHAGLPESWRIADKSGSGDNNTRNDIGIILRPEAKSILVAVYYTRSPEPLSSREKVIAEIGRFVSQVFGA